jgi:hypothetical protein
MSTNDERAAQHLRIGVEATRRDTPLPVAVLVRHDILVAVDATLGLRLSAVVKMDVHIMISLSQLRAVGRPASQRFLLSFVSDALGAMGEAGEESGLWFCWPGTFGQRLQRK